MEKRVFLAILLSFVVLAGYQAFFAPPPAPAPIVTLPPQAPPAPTAPVEPTTAAAPTPGVATLVGDTAARDIVVDTDVLHVVFSTSGATVKSWQLKRYLDYGEALDLVPRDVPDSFPRPFTIATNDPALSKTLATALFKPSAEHLSLGSGPGTLTFEYRDASGLTASKRFYFQQEGKPYVVKVEAAVDVAGASRPVTLTSGPGLGLGYTPDGSRSVPARAVQFHDGSVQRLATSALQKQSRYEGEMKFAGVEDPYFLNAVLPGSEKVAVEYTPISLPVKDDPKGRTRTFVSYAVGVPGPLSLQFFLGPKDFDILRAVDPRLELVRAIDFGIFSWLVVPLLQALKWINQFLHNYGWSIVALTVFINLVIFPLRHRSMVSMKKMQAIQPEMKAIQDRYAKYKLTDPERQKMNTEMMALYKQKGVNPASGCVPMLLTLPVLFAFYAMLSAAIELRGAPFMGWIHDLSRHDPYYITPFLMAGTMLWQQWMMPSTADPVQKRMFMLMPVIFLVSFLWAPSGLVIYWLVSNLLAIAQQALTNRLIGTPVRTVPAARRVASGSNAGGRKS